MYHTSATRIYKVRHRSLGELRILKVISKAHMQGFSYEAETLRSLRHPGIPILYDYGEDEESICLIEEYIRGVSLQEYLLHHSIITRDWSMGILRQVCDILQYLHEQKPTPILYQLNGGKHPRKDIFSPAGDNHVTSQTSGPLFHATDRGDG